MTFDASDQLEVTDSYQWLAILVLGMLDLGKNSRKRVQTAFGSDKLMAAH